MPLTTKHITVFILLVSQYQVCTVLSPHLKAYQAECHSRGRRKERRVPKVANSEALHARPLAGGSAKESTAGERGWQSKSQIMTQVRLIDSFTIGNN